MSEHPTPAEHGPEGDHGNGAAEAAMDNSLHVEKWEGIWLRVSAVIVVVFILAIVISATALGISVPGATARVNPANLTDPGNPFSNPGLRQLAPGKYEAYIVAQTWMFMPDKIEVPVGSEVTFYLTARDVTHGFKLTGTNINMMAIPGQVGKLTATFHKPGVYNYICHEYCGYVPGAPIGHQSMYGQLTVLPSGSITPTQTVTQTALATN